jgi:ArsR family transcriptional regulator
MNDALRRFKADIFQALAHPTRIAVVEMLRDGELPAGKLIERLGLEQAKQIVVNRKEGNQVFYSLRSPLLIQVLDLMRQYFQTQLTENMAALGEIEKEQGAAR